MAEHGFYHPSRGYWQTTSDVPTSILIGYPEGTVEIPLKPDANAVWDGEQWQAGEPPQANIDDYKAAVQAHLDTAARSRLYTDGNSLATYTASTNPRWAAEAQAFVAWRDAVWSQVYGMWASPPDPVPTPAEVVAGLPVIEWPGAQE